MIQIIAALAFFCVQDDAEVIKKTVFAAQKAGFEKHDYKAYMALFTKDARLIGGRGKNPGKYDVIVEYAGFAASKKLRFSVKPPAGTSLKFENAKVKLKGNKAVLRVVSTIAYPDYHEKVREIYRLRRTKGGWKVYENRYFLLEVKMDGNVQVYNKETWKMLDEKVERTWKTGKLGDVIDALNEGIRLREVYTLCLELTRRQPRHAENWIRRGYAAFAVGEAEDCLKSFKKALELDPKAAVPEYAKKSD